MPDFIPPNDAEFDSWQANHVTYLNAHLVALGLTPVAAYVVSIQSAENCLTFWWPSDRLRLASGTLRIHSFQAAGDHPHDFSTIPMPRWRIKIPITGREEKQR